MSSSRTACCRDEIRPSSPAFCFPHCGRPIPVGPSRKPGSNPVGRRPIPTVLAGEGKAKADAIVLSPEAVVKRIVDLVLESADNFLTSDKVEPRDAEQVRKARDEIAEHGDRLSHILATLREQGT